MVKAITLSAYMIMLYEMDDLQNVYDVIKAKKEISLSVNNTILNTIEIEGINFHIIRYKRKFGDLYFYRVSFVMFDTIHYNYFLGKNINELTNKLGDDTNGKME